ncbi:HEAT repeat domain-containing protein [Paludisphaera mucosa]|uniref:HEAT repeat domain-containing protein n=1 Tax=Paludisphaera mucosa TaxID=3030827 RepID=A0ABT6FGG9_9BACT|nr:HEAT repeat domain-containing protein [Paludisphaera mucosa]MDG3006660.1 HEAT repeat domain-containing protein [Paludisphaera mucosa]
MPQRGRAGLWITGGMAVVAAGAGLYWTATGRRTADGAKPAAGAAAYGESSTTAELVKGLRAGDVRALDVVQKRATPKADAPKVAATEEQATEILDTLTAIRAGFLQFTPPGRAAAAVTAASLLEKISVEPAPARFVDALRPIHDIYSAALADAEPEVRFVALGETRRFWPWIPGRTLTAIEERNIAEWKEAMHHPVVRCLASADVRTRAAAVYSLGFLLVDSAAAPAMAYLDDPAVEVRRQCVISFAGRPALLTEDLLLQRVHDSDGALRDAAFAALKLRGLNQEQISLGALMTSPRADQRASVVALVKDRTDIDPVVWLLRLTHDADETVRIHAVEALGARKAGDASVKRRIVEMAQSDASQEVRQAASKLMPSAEETTASLPPLPGSSLLNPKAN